MELKNQKPLDTQSLLQNYTRQHSALKKISEYMAMSESISQTLPQILATLSDALQAVGARVVMADVENASFGGGVGAHELAKVDDALWAFMPQSVVVPNIEDSPPNLDLNALNGVAVSIIILPLEANGERQGVLWLGLNRAYDLDPSVYEFLELVAMQIAIMLANRPEPGISMSGIEVSQVLAGASDALVIMDNDGNIQLMNTAGQALFGLEEGADTIGSSFYSIVDSPLLHKLLQGKDEEDEKNLEYVTEDGRSFKPSLSPIISKHGLQIGMLLVLWEITRFKRINENMSMFLHTVSHDLRSPLTAAKGFVDMLGMVGELNDKQSPMITKILTSINDMTNLVEKVLDAGRLDPEMGTYELRREPTDPGAIISKVASTLSNAAAQKSISLQTSIAPNLPIVNIDSMMLERALVNLVENAIKYTPENSKVVFGGRVENDVLTFFVNDNGPGIPPEDRERLFKKGERLNRKDQIRVRGSGLGLFIVKNVAQQHGGDASVNSEPGEGSSFNITIPLDGANMLGSGAMSV